MTVDQEATFKKIYVHEHCAEGTDSGDSLRLSNNYHSHRTISHKKQSEARQHVEVGELPLIMHPDCSRSSGSRVEREEEDITEK